MIRAYIAAALAEERSALRLLLLDLNMEVVGESIDWLTTLQFAPESKLNMLLVDWSLLPEDSQQAFSALRASCLTPIVIVLISHMDARKQAAFSSGADAFISKSETPDRVAERLQSVAKGLLN